MTQLLAHLFGDYILQSNWMAREKTHYVAPAIAHAVCYTLPFLFLTRSLLALTVICGSHFVVDHWRLARYVTWAKNRLAPRAYWNAMSDTGYPDSTPVWLAVWLLIIADNTLHLAINALALRYC